MSGFFSNEELPALIKKQQISDGSECYQCGLFKRCQNPKAKVSGDGAKKILIISESPTEVEDRKGQAFTGKSGRLLKSELKKIGIDFDKDCWKTYAVICRVTNEKGEARDPTKQELQLCNPNLQDTIAKLKPRVIITLGKFAIMSLLLHRFNKVKINTFRGLIIPDRKYNAWVLPIFHPSALYKEKASTNLKELWKRDIRQAAKFALTAKPLQKKPNPESQVELITDYLQIVELLEKVIKEEPKDFYFDYETTGLKPDVPGHKIPYISFSVNGKKAYSFPFQHKDFFTEKEKTHIQLLFTTILEHPNINKAAHNCLHGRSFVLMADGSKKRISYLVNKKITDPVLSFNCKTKKIEAKPITNWLRQEDKNVEWYKIITKNSIREQGHLLTLEHPVYIKEKGMTPLFKIKIGDHLLIKKQQLSSIQEQIILGSGLGDGFISLNQKSNAKNPYFIVQHGTKQKEYSYWKYKLCENIAIWTEQKNTRGFSNKDGYLYGFRTKSLPALLPIYQLLYTKKKKIITSQYLEKMNNLAIAIWYMDDGSVDKTIMRLHTSGFSEKSIDLIILHFKNKYGILFKKNKCNDSFNLFVGMHKGGYTLCKMIARYIHPVLSYKIPKYYKGAIGTHIQLLENSIKKTEYDFSKIIAIEKVNPSISKNIKFDIEVADNHNFFTTTGLVSNCKFEDVWSRTILNTLPDPWDIDALLASHIWDNRTGFTGLKLQVYILFGIEPYDLEIKKYLESEYSNGFNKVEEIPVYQALLYSAYDSLFGYWVYSHYKNLLNKPENEGLLQAYNLFHDGNLVFSDMQINGVHADEKYYITKDREIKQKITELTKEIAKSSEARKFQKLYGRPLNIDSPKDLSNLFYTILKYEAEINEKGNKSVDKTALETIDTAFTQKIIKLRQLKKIGDTYLNQFKNEIVDNKIHSIFNLNIPVSYRSSSQAPNLQNIPIREKLAKQICRGGILPSPGNKLLEADYSGIEVRISACVHKDPNMIKYITDPTTDMHRDSASDIWLLPHEKVTKEIRQSGKSDWVFPQFYGSFYKNCAKNSWKTCIDGKIKLADGMLIKDHLKIQKIKNYAAFEKHCEEVENIFWGERFKVYAEWKKEINNLYNKQGWIENKFGFKFKGLMGENDVTNYPIQSLAFHCLLWSLIHINEIAIEEGWRTKIFGQIHDSILFDLYPDEEEHVIKTVNYIGTQKLRKTFNWIIVPMEIEYELTDIDQPWSTKQEIDCKHLFE